MLIDSYALRILHPRHRSIAYRLVPILCFSNRQPCSERVLSFTLSLLFFTHRSMTPSPAFSRSRPCVFPSSILRLLFCFPFLPPSLPPSFLPSLSSSESGLLLPCSRSAFRSIAGHPKSRTSYTCHRYHPPIPNPQASLSLELDDD